MISKKGRSDIGEIVMVHQIRNASRYVVWKDKKQFAADMKNIYPVASKDLAWEALENLESTWDEC